MRLDILKAMNAARRERRAGVMVTRLADGEQRFVEAAGSTPIRSAAARGGAAHGQERRRLVDGEDISSPSRRRPRASC